MREARKSHLADSSIQLCSFGAIFNAPVMVSLGGGDGGGDVLKCIGINLHDCLEGTLKTSL